VSTNGSIDFLIVAVSSYTGTVEIAELTNCVD